jgi:hypothetical protein
MIRIFVLATVACTVMASCSSVTSGPYRPATRPEKTEFAHDHLDIYPDDVRKNPAANTNAPVVWAGIIRSTDAHELDQGGKIMMESVFEHHYFDWVQDGKGDDLTLSVSPRGEGLFRAKWYLNKTGYNASFHSAEKFTKPGKLAIFYGTPEKVETNGTVVMKYRYLRILDQDHFTTNDFDYGRLGEPFHNLHPQVATSSSSTKPMQPVQPRWANSPR